MGPCLECDWVPETRWDCEGRLGLEVDDRLPDTLADGVDGCAGVDASVRRLHVGDGQLRQLLACLQRHILCDEQLLVVVLVPVEVGSRGPQGLGLKNDMRTNVLKLKCDKSL